MLLHIASIIFGIATSAFFLYFLVKKPSNLKAVRSFLYLYVTTGGLLAIFAWYFLPSSQKYFSAFTLGLMIAVGAYYFGMKKHMTSQVGPNMLLHIASIIFGIATSAFFLYFLVKKPSNLKAVRSFLYLYVTTGGLLAIFAWYFLPSSQKYFSAFTLGLMIAVGAYYFGMKKHMTSHD